PTIIVGYPISILPFGEPVLEQMIHFAAPVHTPSLTDWHFPAMISSFIVASLGIGGAVLFYSRWKIFNAEPYAKRFSLLYNLFVNKWYFDKIYSAVLVKPTMALAYNIAKFDKVFVDGIVNGAAKTTYHLSQIGSIFDRKIVDGAVNNLAQSVFNAGETGRRLQSGRLRQYLAFMAVGVVFLFGWLYIWIQN
ncbi:MAG: hypothetical protein RJA81_1322, partial [Planctomycetota bacterium]